jgi:hypothetical protein
MAESLFEEKLHSDKFIVTTEIGPPKGTDVSEMIRPSKLGNAFSLSGRLPFSKGNGW